MHRIPGILHMGVGAGISTGVLIQAVYKQAVHRQIVYRQAVRKQAVYR